MMNVSELKEKYIQPVKVYWDEREPKERKKFYIIGVILLAVIIGLVLFLNNKPYTVLFTQLDSAEASVILTSLQEKGVSAKMEANGTIMVPKEQEAALKMQLAMEGYPKSGLSYDLYMGNVDTMATDSDRKTYQLFQLQERMQEAIKQINGVKSAIVTISLPENNSFVISPNKEAASASVLVTMLGPEELTTGQVNGIKQLVSRSLNGLKKENVSVIDANTGNEMDAATDSIGGRANDKLSIEKSIDQNTEKKVRDILVPIVGGIENVQVVATSQVNMDGGTTQTTIYTPMNETSTTGVTENESHYLEGSDAGILNAGVPGADPNADNTPTYPQVDAAADGDAFVNKFEMNYKVNETKEEVQRANVVVESLKVGVVVNRPNMDAAEKNELTNLVAAAANIPVENVTIYSADFGQTIPTVGQGLIETLQNNKGIVAIAVGVILLLILLLVFLLIRKRRKKAEEFWAPPVIGETDLEIAAEPPKIEETQQQILNKQIRNFANEHPEVAAQLIRSWLKGED